MLSARLIRARNLRRNAWQVSRSTFASADRTWLERNAEGMPPSKRGPRGQKGYAAKVSPEMGTH